MMIGLGAEVVQVDQAPGGQPGAVSGADLALVEVAAQEIAQARGAFRADQFRHPGNALAHAEGTGPEIWSQSGGTLTAFTDFAGSGGTYAGVMQALGDRVRGYVVEPAGAEVLAGKGAPVPEHPIQGGGYAMSDLAQMAGVRVDGYLAVSGDAARRATRDLARIEGIFGGFSAGANVAAALDLLRGPEKGGVIAVIICDSGLKYLSTDLWADAST